MNRWRWMRKRAGVDAMVMNGGHWYQESTRGERLQIDERLIAVASCR